VVVGIEGGKAWLLNQGGFGDKFGFWVKILEQHGLLCFELCSDEVDTLNELESLVLAFETGNEVVYCSYPEYIIFNHKRSYCCAFEGWFQVMNAMIHRDS
jgi:hypothetical protein